MVLLNKVDLYSDEMLRNAEVVLRGINAHAHIIRTSFCTISVDLFPVDSFPQTIHGEYSLCRDPHYESVSIAVSDVIDIELLKEKLILFRDEIYRAKGFVPSVEGTVFIDFSQAGFTFAKITTSSVANLVVAFVIKGHASDELLEVLSKLGQRVT
jgi:G3E family GTPase